MADARTVRSTAEPLAKSPDSSRVPANAPKHGERGSLVVSWALLALAVLVGLIAFVGSGVVFGELSLGGPILPGSWMAWTWAVLVFFVAIGLMLAGMSVWQGLTPETPRLGILGIETTPGDRLFLSLLGSAFICLAWLATMGPPLWGGLALSLVWAAAVFRWV